MSVTFSLYRRLGAFLFAGLVFCLTACEQTSLLQKIQESGELRVVSLTPKTLFRNSLEHDLLTHFAQSLNVKMHITHGVELKTLMTIMKRQKAHIAIQIPDRHRPDFLRFTLPYLSLEHPLIQHRDSARTKSWDTLTKDTQLATTEGSLSTQLIHALDTRNEEFMWQRICPKSPGELMQKVSHKKLDFLLTDTDQFSRYRYAYPKLRVAFNLPEKTHLAWGILEQKDDSLYLAASNFLQRPRTQRLIENLKDQYHWRINYPYNYVDIKLFQKAMKTHLPQYVVDFKAAGKKHGIDWRLLAAIGYQESHWKRSAKSPTGVRGIMMLTQPTAKEVGVKNRLNPRESIKGGSTYYAHLLSKIPQGIHNPNRTLFALAAYNVGLGHVKDAMTIAHELNLPWNSWAHLKMALPLLQQKKWYKNEYVKYGFARGKEAVNYVERIRHYYDLLKQLQGDGETAGVTTSPDGEVTYSGGNLPLNSP